MKKRYGLLLFIAAMSIFLFGCMLLVTNRQDAATQAKQIVASDQVGTNVDTDIIKLKLFATSHMKVNVQFVLTGSYDRAVAAAKAKASKTNVSYAAAQAACDKKGVDSIRQSQCVSTYLAAHPAPVVTPKMPDAAIYTYHIIGPAWSFDLAGLMLLFGALVAVVAIISVVHRAVTK